MQKAKHRTKTVSVPEHSQSGNGFHKNNEWAPGDPPEKHPLFSLMGKYKDDSGFEEYVQLMKNLRQEELERDLRQLDEAE